MNARRLAAFHVLSLNVAVLAFVLLLLPMTGFSFEPLEGGDPGAGGAMTESEWKNEFLEYASINDIDIHELFFSTILYEGTESCLLCHQKEGIAALDMGHFKWQGKTTRIEGLESGEHGKNDLLNNFCIAIPSNEPRCTQCHIGYGYKDTSFNFQNPENVDCLVCHDQSDTYAKAQKNQSRSASKDSRTGSATGSASYT